MRVITYHWACENGGDDIIGSQADMRALVDKWRGEPDLPPHAEYEVFPYTGEDGSPPPKDETLIAETEDYLAKTKALADGRALGLLRKLLHFVKRTTP
jgi:hypothetical protein